MATFDYEGLRVTALQLIERFGASMVLKSVAVSGSKFDPTLIPANVSCIGVLTKFKNRDIDGTRIQAKDRKVILAADQAVPKASDRLVAHGVEYQVIAADPVKPADVTLVWHLQVRP